jgi:uncharacterized protein (TIGR02466 family)
MAIQEIFSVPVYKIKLDLNVKELQSFCNKYQYNDIVGKTVSNHGGYHSSDLSLDDVILQPLIGEIKTHSSKFAKTFFSKNKQILNNMWFNINLYKDYNVVHHHAGDDISGVYYIKTPNECGNIIFEHPIKDLLNYYLLNIENRVEVNNYTAGTWWMPAEVNMLYLFPAWLNHSVETNKNKTEERISIGFNTYHVRGDKGD